MLEEAVKNDKSNPSEVALSLLQFIQNEMPAGGSGAENRFIRMYVPINNRIFGPILGAKDNYKHAEGGWMSATTAPWYNPRSSSSASVGSTSSSTAGIRAGSSSAGVGSAAHRSISRSPSSALEQDPVVRFLGTAINGTGSGSSALNNNNREDFQPTLIEAISKESANRPTVSFPVPFHAFPENLQQAWLALLDASWAGQQDAPDVNKCSLQTARLLQKLLRKPPLEQTDLLNVKQNKARKKEFATPLMQLSPRGFPATSTPSHNPLAATRGGTNSKDHKPAEPYVYFGMLEYYLFLFLRYPLAVPVPKTNTTAVGVNSHRQPYRRTNSGGSSIMRARRTETYGDSMYYLLFQRYLAHFVPHGLEEFSDLSRESELFLHAIVSLWLESQGRCQTTQATVQRLFRGDTTGLNLNSSHELVLVKYDPPFMQVRKCLLYLVRHLVLDPSVEVRDGPNYVLPKAMALLQEPFFNYVRASFRTASIHAPESPFYSALEAWLTWLEPWNVNKVRRPEFSAQNATQRLMGAAARNKANHIKRVLASVKHNTPSRYSSKWEAYVAANLHLYTVPLAIFLRRARELDFSAPNFERALQTVNRVFRVFCPAVNLCLNRLLAQEVPQYIPLVNHHVEALEPYAPPNTSALTISSCQEDMKILLEEVYLQHSKKLRDLDIFQIWEAKIGSLFGSGVISGEEKTLHKLVEQARNMVNLPADYQLVPSDPSRQKPSAGAAAKDQHSLAYNKDGILVDEDFEKVFLGETKCNPADAVFKGDALHQRRLGTEEVGILVEVFVFLSDYVHSQTGCKINLRYLANWRHLTRTLVAVWLFFLLLWVCLFR